MSYMHITCVDLSLSKGVKEVALALSLAGVVAEQEPGAAVDL